MEIDQNHHIPNEDSSLVLLPSIFHDFELLSYLIFVENLRVYFFCCFGIKFFNFIRVCLEEFLLTIKNRIKLLFVSDLVC